MSEEVDLDIYTPVCLAQTSDTDTFYGKSAWVYGWGTTASGGSASATLLEVCVSFHSEIEEHCHIRWVSPWWPLTSAQWPWGPGRRDRSAPGERRARTAARWAGSATLTAILIIYHQGDSGGPLTYEAGDQHILIGDVSFGSGCAGVWLETVRKCLMFAF